MPEGSVRTISTPVAPTRRPPAADPRDPLLQLVRRAREGYGNTMKVAGAGDPEAFCDKLLETLSEKSHELDQDLSAFFAWGTEKFDRLWLLHVLRARHALQNQNWAVAILSARRVNVVNPEDTFVQSLLVAAQKRTTSLRSEVDEWLKDRFCARPFEAFETRINDKVYTCCSAWISTHIGEFGQAPADIWNSDAAQEIRRSVLDGDYRYCSRMYCPLISNRVLKKKDEVTKPKHRRIIDNHTTRVDEGPTRVLLSHDRSCNLSCPSCRTEVITADKAKQASMKEFAEKTILPMMKDARRVKVTGSGDPFGSNHIRYVMSRLTRSEFPDIKLEIQTNGVLFDRKAWNDLDLDGRIDSVWVSPDAASRETYDIVRRGGDFDRLMENLQFLGEMRRAGKFRLFRLDFVVQWRNYREMLGVVKMAEACGADTVAFQRIRNWGTFSIGEFTLQDICDSAHPEHRDFLEVLQNPDLRAANVDWGNIRPFLDAAS